MSRISAFLPVLFLASAVCAQPFGAAQKAYQEELHKDIALVSQAFLSGQPVEAAVPDAALARLDAMLKAALPPGLTNDAPMAVQSRGFVNAFKTLRIQAAGAQKGRDSSTLPEVWLESLRRVSVKLSLVRPDEQDGNWPRIASLYGSKLRDPSLGERSRDELLLEAEAAERLLGDKRVNQGLQQRIAVSLGKTASALGGLIFINADGNSAVVGWKGGDRPMTVEELERMAKLPRVQLPREFKGFGSEPPFPIQPIAKHAPKPGEAGFNYGWASGAVKWWQDLENDVGDSVSAGKTHWFWGGLAATGTTIMRGLLNLSGLPDVEQADLERRWQMVRTTDAGAIGWAVVKEAGDIGLAALTFIPGVGMIGKAGKGAKVAATAGRGTEVVVTAGKGVEVANAVKGPASLADDAARLVVTGGDDALKAANAGKKGVVRTVVNAVDKVKMPSILNRHAKAIRAVTSGLDDGVRAAVKSDLEGILEKALPKGQTGEMTAKQFNTMLDGIFDFAKKNGIEFVKRKETVGVFPEGLQKIGLAGFDKIAETAKVVPQGNIHEMTHLFHCLQMRVNILRSMKGGKYTAAEAENFLKALESGNNYLELEKAVTGAASWAHKAREGARDVALFAERVKGLLTGTDAGMAIGKISFPAGATFEEVYAVFLSKLPILVGTGAKSFALTRFPPMIFATYYIQNPDCSSLGITIPKDWNMEKRGFRDFINEMLVRQVGKAASVEWE